MKTRYRWYEATLSGGVLKTLVERMQKDQFSARNPLGFRIEAVRRDWVRGELIERYETVEVVETPTGEKLEFPFVGFNRAAFRLTSEFPHIELVNPSKLSRTLITRLGELLDFEFTVKPIDLDPVDWLRCIEKEVGAIQVTGITIANIAVTDVIRAQVKLEGADDVREHVSKFVRTKKFKADSLRGSTKRSGVAFELGQTARATLDSADLVDDFRVALAAWRGPLGHVVELPKPRFPGDDRQTCLSGQRIRDVGGGR